MTTSSTSSSRASPDDEPGERPPAQVRLDAEEDHRVAVETGDRRVVEGVLGPLELPGQPLLEGHLRAGRLEVEEVLRVDLREPLRAPHLREVVAAERRALAAVVPAAKRGDQDRPAKTRPRRDVELRHGLSLVGEVCPSDRSPEPRHEPHREREDRRRPRPRGGRRPTTARGCTCGTGARRSPSARAGSRAARRSRARARATARAAATPSRRGRGRRSRRRPPRARASTPTGRRSRAAARRPSPSCPGSGRPRSRPFP